MELMELLWEEQKSALTRGRQHKWHPKVINWCLSIYHSSHSNYKHLMNGGFLLLPHPRTLQRHAHKLDVDQGVTKARFDMLRDKVAQHPLGSEELLGALVFDEMHIQVRAWHALELVQHTQQCRPQLMSAFTAHIPECCKSTHPQPDVLVCGPPPSPCHLLCCCAASAAYS